MRIALNLLYLIPGVVGGTETYAVSLIKALALIDQTNGVCSFPQRESAELELVEQTNLTRVVCPLRATRRPVRYAWEQSHPYHAVAAAPHRHCTFTWDMSAHCSQPCMSIALSTISTNVALEEVMSPLKRRVLSFFSPQSAAMRRR